MREVLLGGQAPASIVDSDYINCSASPHRRLESDSNLKQNSPLHPKTNLGNSLYSEVISSTEDFEIKVCSVPFGIESEIRSSTRSTVSTLLSDFHLFNEADLFVCLVKPRGNESIRSTDCNQIVAKIWT